MADDQITNAVALAIELEEKGQTKEAYFAFTAASQTAIQSLNEIKFVHSSIVSSPKQYLALLSSIRTCLTHVENIIEQHSPTALQPASSQTTSDSKLLSRPPKPPKPSKMQKPTIPPKPTRVNSRPASPTQKSQENELPDNSSEITIIRPHVHESRPTSLPPQTRNDHPLNVTHRPHTEYPVNTADMNHSSSIHIVAEGEIDPNYLVPAQTSAGDSLAPSSSIMNHDHVPLIPAPPLLTTHRVLQAKVNDLEEKIRNCRARKQAIAKEQNPDASTEDSLDQMIAQYLRVLAELKATLNGVRTTYISAATIPSILQFQAHVIAYQITLIEAAIFSAIPPHALLEHSSKHPHPRIVASTDFFNYITRIIEHSILLPQEASARAQIIHYWIKVASRCFDINNYQTLKAIISALSTPPVQRLRRTWAYVPKKSFTKLETLNDLMSEGNNYGNYREHMGMVSTAVVNGKSVQLIRDEHFARPTVPFLGTFIHDITYLLAAFKSSPNAATMNSADEPRIHDVLHTMHQFQSGPRYTPTLPPAFLKSSQKHHFRPSLSNALHRGASRIQRFSGGSLFGSSFDSNTHNSSSSNTSLSSQNYDVDDEDNNLEEQQKMATQYILMRSWVSQNTVDELSHLREPPPQQMRSNGGLRSNSSNSSISMNRTSSMFSNTSRFSNGSMNYLTESRPTSMDDDLKRRSNGQSLRPATIHEGLSKEEIENFHIIDNKPVVPPRPPIPPPPLSTSVSNDEFKTALAQRLAKVERK
ncbi:ras guanine nucleotide exchange factor domain-containing protein [Cokeromyces recurvatus]|uniref:ras guanine nucleotide exchange factor domain-containing protein n=1 Tax=Cokeromyces recurvatus TaxID=90255 RepID=UPI00221EDF62|nr:ras guanine nucleotide exchange factor domain-containing protein [Cokeromyces recurvatus]KAI7906630.1 ras guanine nucleotide exchange factor domain-containing protein [Cokeromyces recurvatus]